MQAVPKLAVLGNKGAIRSNQRHSSAGHRGPGTMDGGRPLRVKLLMGSTVGFFKRLKSICKGRTCHPMATATAPQLLYCLAKS